MYRLGRDKTVLANVQLKVALYLKSVIVVLGSREVETSDQLAHCVNPISPRWPK